MSHLRMPRALVLSTLALAVAVGPLTAAASATGGGDHGPGSFTQGGLLPPKAPTAGQDPQDAQDPQDPKGPRGPKDPAVDPDSADDGTDHEPGGTYSGAAVHTTADISSKPTAQPMTPFEMPFPCGEVWTGTTRPDHSPSARSVDWNRVDDFQDPVVAAAAGVVITAVTGKDRPSYGQFVVIDHGNGESTLYGHLDSVTVVVGQAVTAGTQIGTLGDTGNSYGAHLHFEERLGSSVVDAWFHGARYVFGTAQESQNCGAVTIADVPLAGQVVGDKRADLVVFRRTATPAFYVRREPRTDKVIKFGGSTDQPVLGDWDGNGKASPGVRTGKVFNLKSGRKVTSVTFGGKADLAVAGDWDGNGIWEVGTRRPTSNLFRLRGADGKVTKVRLGDTDDLPVTGDWDGDGVTDLGVYDSATAMYTLRTVDDSGMEWLSQVGLGQPGDLPVVGDWDANGVTDIGVWDPDTASFSMRNAPTPMKNMRGRAKIDHARFGIGR